MHVLVTYTKASSSLIQTQEWHRYHARGAIKYKVWGCANVSNEFILQTAVQKIAAKLEDAVALILGKAIIWAAFALIPNPLPDFLHNHIRDNWAVQNAQLEDVTTNPIVKTPVYVTSRDGEGYIDEIPQGYVNQVEPSAAPTA